MSASASASTSTAPKEPPKLYLKTIIMNVMTEMKITDNDTEYIEQIFEEAFEELMHFLRERRMHPNPKKKDMLALSEVIGSIDWSDQLERRHRDNLTVPEEMTPFIQHNRHPIPELEEQLGFKMPEEFYLPNPCQSCLVKEIEARMEEANRKRELGLLPPPRRRVWRRPSFNPDTYRFTFSKGDDPYVVKIDYDPNLNVFDD